MKNTIKLVIFLLIVSIACAAVLAGLNSITEPVIAKNEKEKINLTLKELLPKANDFKEKEIPKIKELSNVYEAYDGDQKIATILQVFATGFQSDIKLLVAITPEGKYDGFKVIEQAETPGYGDVIVLSKKYVSQFKKKNIDESIDTVSGSTVTTGAVKKAIETAIKEYKEME